MSKKICEIIVSAMLIFIVAFSFSSVKAAPIENNPDWNVHFENIQIKEGSVTATTAPTINTSSTEITYGINLDAPGQFYEFTVDVKNSGSINAMLDDVLGTSLTAEQQKYLSYSATYNNGASLNKNDKLDVGSTEKIKVRVSFRTDINPSDLPNSDSALELKIQLRYVQADQNAQEPEEPDNPENPEDPNKPEEQEKPSGTDESSNKGQSEISKNDNKEDSKAKPTGAQTGDSIIIYFVIVALAVVVLIFARTRKNEEK